MRTRTMISLLLITGGLILARVAMAGDAAKTGTIVVTGVDFEDDEGHAVIAIYRRGAHWLELDKAFLKRVVDIKKGKVTAIFRDLPYDEYAVTVLHDANDNGKMDMQWLPIPKPEEGGGVSNNWVRKGKPEYHKARFDLARPMMSVRIKLVY